MLDIVLTMSNKFPPKKQDNEFIIKAKPKLVFSEYQRKIFKEINQGKDNVIVIARAGSSKTTVLVEGSKFIPKGTKTLFCAFNKSIQEELRNRLSDRVECSTLHSLGLRGIKQRFPGVEIDNQKCFSIAETVVGSKKQNYDLIDSVCKAVSLCKANLYDIPSKIEEIVLKYNIDTCDQEMADFSKFVLLTLRKCKEETKIIDFDDMIWFPFVYKMNIGKWDLVMVDEFQDLNKAQIELALSVKSPKGRVIAVGDNRQCVEENTILETKNGFKKIKDITIKDEVKSFENTKIVFKKILNHSVSSWDEGFKITTQSGKELIMSPNHKIWAEQQDVQGKYLVYLMYRKDLGFRVGKTNKWKANTNPFGARAIHEQADKLWVIDVVDDNESAILQEELYSLEYGIPTCVFNGEQRGLNQNRINLLFNKFGQNGMNLLNDKNYSFDHPHWIGRSMSISNKSRFVVRISAQGSKNSNVNFEISDAKIIDLLKNNGITGKLYKRRENNLEHFSVRKWFSKYTDALMFANKLSNLTGAYITENLSFGKEDDLRLIPASQLFVGMSVISKENTSAFKDKIVSIDKVNHRTFYDIEVEDTANFFGNNILSHNCIYSWRGADSNMLDVLRNRLNPKELTLPICYRCPIKVVRRAQEFVPDIQPFDKAAPGEIHNINVSELMTLPQPGDAIISRTNAPLIKQCLKLLKAGKPANILGRDIGDGLFYLVKKSKKKTVVDLLKWLLKWEKEEKEKILIKYPNASTEVISDKAECIRMFCEDAESIEDIKENIKKLFQDGDNSKVILHSSVHRAKGSEYDNVFIFADTLRGGTEEEENIHYVAITRAKKRLYMARKPTKYSAYDDKKEENLLSYDNDNSESV